MTQNQAARFGPYRYWGEQKPDRTRPLLSLTRGDAVRAKAATQTAEAAGDDEGTPTTRTATLRIYGPIDSWGGWWGVSAKEVAQALDVLGDVDQLVVRVNSPGGDAFEGRAIMNLLRAHQARCIAVVDGLAASAASYVAVGCDETVMAPGTELMIHDTHVIIYGDEAALLKEAAVVGSISRSGAELYADVAGGTVEEWRQRQKDETWFTASEAVAIGLADRVGIVPDAGPIETADEQAPEVDEGDLDELAHRAFDLSMFQRAGREQAPAPKPPAGPSAPGSTTEEKESAMPLSDQATTTLRQKLGITEDADEATILAALDEALEERSESTPVTTPPEGMALIEQSVLEELRSHATAGHEARQQQLTETRDRTIDAAIQDGRTTRARREHWQKAWDADPEGTATTLASLEKGLVPVSELGSAGEGTESADPAAGDDYWFPGVPTPVTTSQEG